MEAFLRRIPLFAELSNEDMLELCGMVTEQQFAAGELMFAEGSTGDCAYVIVDGAVEISKQAGNRDVLLAVREGGEVIGEMALLQDAPRSASVRARTEVRALVIGYGQLDNLLKTSPSAARAMLHTVTSRWRVTEAMLRQSENMAKLGTVAAGVAHELNNPSAAVQRGAGQLRAALVQLQDIYLRPDENAFTRAQYSILRALNDQAKERAANPQTLDPLACADREYELEMLLDSQGMSNGWEFASTLVSLGFDVSGIEALSAHFTPPQFANVIAWLVSSYTIYTLLETVGHGALRISDIVKSLKTYVFLDQAPVQEVDIHEGLDNTLLVIRSKMKPGITIRRSFAPNVPRIQAYGSELNQVWTNIVDNAVYALGDAGEIAITTCREGDWVTVEIEDNGPGIPDAAQPRVFDPFFTTKPPGHGTGMGLSIAYNVVVEKHRGEIKVYSRPGKTTFRVRLPVNFEAVSTRTQTDDNRIASDEKLRDILTNTQTIAVVGLSSHTDRPAYTVPAYLQTQGYQIIPVNPELTEALGEKAYGDLRDVPVPIDVTLIFRSSDAVPEIVDRAIEVGSRVVWMQEGIIHEEAARIARDAHLDVVMDTCMRSQHQRLIRRESRGTR